MSGNGQSRPKALIAWSSGKDSAWALHEARRAGSFDIVGALTTVTDTFSRVSMHGVREELLRAQLEAAGLPAIIVRIPYPCPNEIYEREMAAAIADAKARGVTHMIFGDLYLEDVRAYRERQLAGSGITPVFPLWQRPTDQLARDMIAGGLETYLATVDLKQAAGIVRGAQIRCGAARGFSARHRSLRREWRIPFLRCGRPDAGAQNSGQGRRNRRARRLCLCGFVAGITLRCRPGQAREARASRDLYSAASR